MRLGEKQRLFAILFAEFIVWCYDNDYEITFGEAFRPDWVAEIYAKQGKGIRNTLHTSRLAVDINLFIKGAYQTNSEVYRPLGEKWKSMHPLNRWGGDFKNAQGEPRPDGNHFSMEHEGVK